MNSQRLARTLGLSFLLLEFAAPGFSKPGAVPAELREKARVEGQVAVVVQVEAPSAGEDDLTSEATRLRRAALAAAVDQILADCAETGFSVSRRFETVRYVALDASAATLEALERSALAANVVEVAPSAAGGLDAIEWTVSLLDAGDRLMRAVGRAAAHVEEIDHRGAEAAEHGTAVAATAPSFLISLDKSTYVNGDTIKVTEFALSNPGPAANVSLRIWMKLPILGEITLINVRSVEFPGNVNVSLGAFSLLRVGSFFPPKGSYEFNSRISDPTSGAVLSEDLNAFAVQ